MKIPFFSSSAKNYKEVSPKELSSLPEGTRLIDVREPAEFAQDHLDAAELVPLGTLSRTAAAWDKHRPLLVICRSGNRSSRGCQELVALGFDQVMNLSGGMMAVRAR